MKTSLLLPVVSLALVLAAPAFAQTVASSQQDTQTNQRKQTSQNHEGNVLTIRKLKQDLENAGFSDVKVLQDSFVIQAQDKEGNPTIMSLSPSGVLAISELSQNGQTASHESNQHGRTARAGHPMTGPGQSSGPAEGTNVAPSQGGASSGEPGTPGFPGDKNGPAVTPPRQ